MKRLAALVCASVSTVVVSGQYVPPDLYDEDYNTSIGFWENGGQVVMNDSIPVPGVAFYSEGGYPRAYLQDDSKVSFVVSQFDTASATPDTTYRLDMRPYGPNAKLVKPVGVTLREWHQNFYMAHTDTSGVEGVVGYSRVVYEEIFPDIDMHFYSGRKGQKMAFVLRPGCDPADLKLSFDGQDSMNVDLLGNLTLYADGRWLVMPFVQAYQVDGTTVAPVSWTAQYEVEEGQGLLKFHWSYYDPELPLVFQIGLPPFGPASFDEDGLCWGTYMGGGEQDNVYESLEDENGNYYIVGSTGSTFLSFPEAPGTTYSNGGTAAYMIQFNSDDDIEWKTFFGGNVTGETTQGTAIGHKEDDQVYLGGNTTSASMVHQQLGAEFYQTTANAGVYKGFIARLSKLNGVREWSTYYGDDYTYINGMVGLGGKKLFVVGSTISTIPALDVSPPSGSTYWPFSSETDGFISMFGDVDQHAWRTHITGETNDPAYDVDAVGSRVVVMGGTHSEDMHLQEYGTNTNVEAYHDLDDCYLYEFDEYGALKWGTYVGSPGGESSFHNGLAIDPVTGDVVLVGYGGSGLDVVEGPGWYQSSYPVLTGPGFIARFSGVDRSRIWHTYLHNGASSYTWPATCAFDPTGKLLVAGYSRDGAGVLSQPLAGLYEQAQYNADVSGESVEQKDPFIVAFGTENELLYGSYFGGEANPGYPEWIFTLLPRRANGNIYLGGVTSRANNTTSYFPLDDGGGVPYFEENWHGGVTEGFLASICAETLNEVGMREEDGDPNALLTAHWSNDLFTVFGLPSGRHAVQVMDATGRMVLHTSALSDGVRLGLVTPDLAEGTYLFQAGGYVARFVVIH